MIIKCLIDNTTQCPAFCAEHGLSFYIETSEKRILFDTGSSSAFMQNANRFGIDLANVDMCIISHGHCDHTGGLKAFIAINNRAPIYVSRYAFEKHVSSRGDNIGMDLSLADSDRIIYVDGRLSLGSELELLSCNSQKRKYPVEYDGLDVIQNGVQKPDDFRHEQYLMITENSRKILISGCSHKGILNIMDWLKPDVLIGGFHLMGTGSEGASEDTLKSSAEMLLSYPTEYYTGHCTGIEQYSILKHIMGDRLHYLSAGMTAKI